MLGVLQQSPRSFLQGGSALDEARIQQLIAERLSAKKARDFAAADRIRDELAAMGVVLKDGAGGTTWGVQASMTNSERTAAAEALH